MIKKTIVGALLTVATACSVYAHVLDVEDVNPDGYVLLIATSQTLEEATIHAQKVPEEQVYILEDNKKFTVRIVNIPTLEEAKSKLVAIKKVFGDAIHWKKMTFLKKSRQITQETNTTIEKSEVLPMNVSTSDTSETAKLVFENLPNGEVITQLVKDTKVYSAQAPHGKYKDEFKQGYYVKGILNETKDWFIILKISTNKSTWFDIPSPLWFNINE